MVGGQGRLGLGGTRWMVYYACVLHLAWAVLLVVNPAAGHSTPVAGVESVAGGRWPAVVVLVGVAVAAAIAIALFFTHDHPVVLPALLVPQQLVLFLSAGSGLHAAAVEHYADLTPRPWEFIAADQLPVVLAAFLYTVALVSIARYQRPS